MDESQATQPTTHLSATDVAEIVADQDAAYGLDHPLAGVALIMGAGCSVKVHRGFLVLTDGLGPTRRERRFPRAMTPGPGRLHRVIFEAGDGYITLGALAWCSVMGVQVVGLDRSSNHRLSFTTLPAGSDDARLRRAQALAGATDLTGRHELIGLGIVRQLLGGKLAGQAAVARDRLDAPEAAQTMEDLRAGLDDVGNVDGARQLEATAANVYWDTWAANPATNVVFVAKDSSRVPEHWLRFDTRRSVLGAGNSNRKAERPLNAMLNYVYSLARSEAVLACRVIGLDPGLGILHLDTTRRDSMALDLMEPVRPVVERWLLDLLTRRHFRRPDFLEGPDGEVRLGMTLRQELAGTMPTWARAVAPHAEDVRALLARAIEGRYVGTAPLTGTARKAAAQAVKARKSQAAQARSARQRPPQPELPLPSNCVECGGGLARDRHRSCPTCWATQPGQSENTRRRRGRGIAATRAELEAWKAEHPGATAQPEAFEPIRLGLVSRKVLLKEIMATTGLAKSSASMLRSGRHVPALRHWPALAALAGVELPVQVGALVSTERAAEVLSQPEPVSCPLEP